jgi:hypothetical protein
MSIEDRRLRRRSLRAAHRPRFHAAAPYVPYFWSRASAGTSEGEVIAFLVTDRDRRVFPELAGIDVVALQVRRGCVQETRVHVARAAGGAAPRLALANVRVSAARS